LDLKGKTVIVTGSSRGIGEAIAEAYAKRGANIVLNARKPIAEEKVAHLESYGVTVKTLLGDVSDFETAKEIVSQTKELFGSVDVLVNNAGITRDKLIMRMDEEDFDATYQVNLKGTFNMIRHALPLMLKQRAGSIINISSVVGETGNTGQANYAASKAGIIGLTKSAAKELASRNIRVNAIAPGVIDTPMWGGVDALFAKYEHLAIGEKKIQVGKAVPLGYMGAPSDIAGAVVFLASDEASYITAQTLNVDGGNWMS